MTAQIVSFLCPSYNHEKYIRFFLDSLLAQTNPNWELVIVDDCSTDNNINEIKKYDDKRIKLFKNPFNMGINCAINNAFKHASGDIMAFVASDDVVVSDYVETVLKEFNAYPDVDALYGALQLINHDGSVRKGDIWKQSVGTKEYLLQKSFYSMNMMLSPGMALRRSAFAQLYPLPVPLSHYQDYKMHVDIMLNLNFMVTDKILINYRKPSEKSGISVVNENTLRTRKLEENILMDSFLQINKIEQLQDIFGSEALKQFYPLDERLIPFYLGQLALRADTEYKKIWGYNQIAKFIANKDNYILVHDLYGYCYADFLKISKYFEQDVIQRKYLKYKKLFNRTVVLLILMGVALLIK